MEAIALSTEGRHDAALDLETGAIYLLDPQYPDGEMILVTYAGGATHLVGWWKVTEALLLRHARAMAVIVGGTERREYEMIIEHFRHKVGTE